MYRWNPFTNNLEEKGDWFFGGNTLGSKKTLGSIDNQDFGIITNNTERLTVLKDGNVGIGTTVPVNKQHIVASSNGDGLLLERDSSTLDDNVGLLFKVAANDLDEYKKAGIFFSGLASSGRGNLIFATNNLVNASNVTTADARMVITADGNVGIGTTAPNNKLTISNGVSNVFTKIDANSIKFTRTSDGADRGIIRFNGIETLTLDSFAGNGIINFLTDGKFAMTVFNNQNVGIGTTAPNQQLEITKNFRLPATVGTNAYGVIYKDGNRFIHNFNYGDNGVVTTNGGNTFIGIDAGNFTMGSTASATSHSSYNTGIGASALNRNTTGSYNSAIGMQALVNNTTGSYNSAIGVNALYSNTTGNNNSAMGYNAGRYLSDGTGRETGNNGLYLGSGSKASANGTNNEIVIGFDAIGKGSNTIKLGNSSILATYTDGEIYKGKEQSKVQGVVFTQTADKTIGNTTTETTMFNTGVGSLTIPANSLVAGRTYRIKLKGYASGTNSDTSTLKVKLGTTELVSSTGTWQTLTDIGFDLEFDFTCRTTGTTGTVAGNGYSLVSGGQGFSTVSMRALLAGTDTINTTVDQVIDLTYQWGSASAGNTITITNASVEVLN